MEITLISIFVLGYLAITLEHTLKIDKLIPASVSYTHLTLPTTPYE